MADCIQRLHGIQQPRVCCVWDRNGRAHVAQHLTLHVHDNDAAKAVIPAPSGAIPTASLILLQLPAKHPTTTRAGRGSLPQVMCTESHVLQVLTTGSREVQRGQKEHALHASKQEKEA